MDARNNLANQEVFKMARTADPRGDRTVGIITKCDVVQTGDEASVRRLSTVLKRERNLTQCRSSVLPKKEWKSFNTAGLQLETALHPTSRKE